MLSKFKLTLAALSFLSGFGEVYTQLTTAIITIALYLPDSPYSQSLSVVVFQVKCSSARTQGAVEPKLTRQCDPTFFFVKGHLKYCN